MSFAVLQGTAGLDACIEMAKVEETANRLGSATSLSAANEDTNDDKQWSQIISSSWICSGYLVGVWKIQMGVHSAGGVHANHDLVGNAIGLGQFGLAD